MVMSGINLLWSSDFSRLDPPEWAGRSDNTTLPQRSGTVNRDAPDGERVPQGVIGSVGGVIEAARRSGNRGWNASARKDLLDHRDARRARIRAAGKPDHVDARPDVEPAPHRDHVIARAQRAHLEPANEAPRHVE